MLKTWVRRTAISATVLSAALGGPAMAQAAPAPATPTVQIDPNPATNGTYIHHGSPRDGCRQLGYVGDSLSDQTLGAWGYLTYGFNLYNFNYRINASVGRSVVSPGYGSGERAGSAADVARQFKAAGADCFVYAIGTNDAAEIRGDRAQAAARIDTMMRIANGSKVRWVMPQTNVPKLLQVGPYVNYSDANMDVFRQALLTATKKYPNLTLDRWDDVAKNTVGFWLPDGIHMLGGRLPFADFVVMSTVRNGYMPTS